MILYAKNETKRKYITLDGYVLYFSEINEGLIDLDFFVFDLAEGKFYPNSVNEYFSSCTWQKKRLKRNPDLGFKYSSSKLISENSIKYSPKKLEFSDSREEYDCVFVYDYSWGHNYQHWLITSISRLMMFVELKKIYKGLKLLHHFGEYSYKDEAISLFGILEEDVIDHSEVKKYKNILLPDFINRCGDFVSDFSISRYESLSRRLSTDLGDRKIYLARDDSNGKRPLSNRLELDRLMSNNGFEKILLETLSLKEKINIFYNATSIAGDFSAGWGHIVFCKKGTSVLLIEHDIFVFQDFYNSISIKKGLEFFSFRNKSKIRRFFLFLSKVYWTLGGNVDDSANKLRWKADLRSIDCFLSLKK